MGLIKVTTCITEQLVVAALSEPPSHSRSTLKSSGISNLFALVAVLLVLWLIGVAVLGVIERHAEEHGHYLTRPNACAPQAQRGESGPLPEFDDGGGVHAVTYAPGSLSDAVRRRRNGSDTRK